MLHQKDELFKKSGATMEYKNSQMTKPRKKSMLHPSLELNERLDTSLQKTTCSAAQKAGT